MTPTNEAGHGLLVLPEPNITDVIERELHRVYMEHVDYKVTTTLLRSFAEAAFSVFEAQQKGEAALALSRGVPEGYALVPIDLRTSCDVWEAGIKARNSGGSVADIWAAMLAAAPAAAGAQGEAVCPNCDGRGEVGGPVGQTAETFDYVTEPCPECTPQPAAADGGVRERARELLAAEIHANGKPDTAKRVRDGEDITDPMYLTHMTTALRAIEAALSSHRQAGDKLPVAEVRGYGDGGGVTMCWTSGKLAIGTKLYTAPPPGADLSKFRELAEGWRAGVGTDLETRLQCADELIALVEKGAGNGR